MMATESKTTKIADNTAPLSTENSANMSVVMANERFSLSTLLLIFHTNTNSTMMIPQKTISLLNIKLSRLGDVATP